MDQYFIRFPGFRKKVVTLSYDDGVVQDERLLRLLDAHGMKGTFNLCSSYFTDPVYTATDRPRLSPDEALKLYGSSVHEIAVHGLTHPFLTQYPAGRAAWEVIRDRNNLEAFFSRIVRGMAYPMGRFNDELVETLKHCGIVYARTTVSSHGFELPEDWLRLKPTCHHDDPELFELCESFLKLDYPFASKMFYLWGHAYEFDENKNWSTIERFCELMSGHEDIWYATNIEIYDYLNAASRLVLSADGKIVCNPTALSICFEYHEGKYLIHSGEALMLD